MRHQLLFVTFPNIIILKIPFPKSFGVRRSLHNHLLRISTPSQSRVASIQTRGTNTKHEIPSTTHGIGKLHSVTTRSTLSTIDISKWEMKWPSSKLLSTAVAVSAGVLYSKHNGDKMDQPSSSGSRKDDKEPSDEDKKEQKGSDSGIDSLLEMFARKLGLSKHNVEKKEQLLEEVNFNGVVNYIQSGKCKNIIVLAGAGISTSAGIPDFRSPGSGLYDNLKKYNLPYPEAIFELSFFKSNPEPFFALAKELYPGTFQPSKSHYFVRLLNDKELLLRMYTQNIDTLERIAGIPEEKLVEAHGTFFTSHCMKCRKEYTLPWMKEKIFADEIPKCTSCSHLVKPDIVFFGEELPDKFCTLTKNDFPKCDLLIIMGTSLVVQPFASLVDSVSRTTPRLLINKEKAGEVRKDVNDVDKFLYIASTDEMMLLLGYGGGMMFDSESNYRDVAWLGPCDDGCQALADALNWGQELKKMVSEERQKLAQADSSSSSTEKNAPTE